MIPTLQTERLTLRPAVFEDFETYAELMTSERSTFMGGPYDRHQAWGEFCIESAQWHLFGHGALMIEQRSDDTLIGLVGINHGPFYPEKELGWMLFDGFEGQGYATEAAECLRDWAFAELGVKTLVSYIDQNNASSIEVAKRLGGTLDMNAERNDPEDVVYRYYRK